jgi:deazaflavin-dependent oxidoreductase (nitroreductase family)
MMTSSSDARPKPPPPTVPLRFLMMIRGPRTFAIDRAILRWTGFSLGCFQIAVHRRERYYPSLLLTTIGRTSQRLRSAALPYVRRGDELVIVASLGGGPTEPDWARNLRAEPRCWITVRRRQVPARARFLDGQERLDAIQQVAEGRKSVLAYDELANSYGREMAVIALSPL